MTATAVAGQVRRLEDFGADDVPLVGGKNASRGEIVRSLKKQGVRVPDGFASTVEAYRTRIEPANGAEQVAPTTSWFIWKARRD